uniref:Odorant-binding protein 17 n=1 Tax=Cyrtorhinus lividipennis TaxID=1032904 RepID=A0A346THZ9_9HEMI|nr:odorant-binding protein 17 [Cyrtorhinus lividipennis]
MQNTLFLVASALLIAFVAAAPNKPSVKDLVQGVSKKCAAQTKASAEQSKLAFSQGIPKDETEKCYLECVYSGVGLIKDNKFNDQGGKKLVELRFQEAKQKELANKLIATCAKEIAAKENEKCSLGRAVRECFATHGKQVNFFPSA